ncbi:beta-ketoacyl synthase N-terminal-like domain-containing protein [Streptomyces sp. NPDC005970]|uniref:type I polyketide synthase n=1 Tax=Streptomyces sp. NPDC005970 TaxID=3156723 RepID=UPI0033C25D2F
MTVANDKIVEALRASLREAERLRKENDRLRTAAREPVAIIGMACRYPGGVESPDDLWTLLTEERDAISAFPRDRGWDLDGLCGPDAHPAVRSAVAEGGFLGGAAEFDPGPFGISPDEASVMDPQQRLLLELAWEVFERAGIDPRSAGGRRYGVFVGTTGQDYTPHLKDVPDELLGHLASGGSSAVLSGRIASVFGLEGPTATLDTACSGSLVALHLACRALRGGECSMALAGGVTVMSSPDAFIGSGRGIGLPVAARCRSFADGADGIAFAEGAGVVLLERLSAARAHGHPVLAVVRGSAIGQEGATNGASASNGPAQRRLIRQALADSELEPHEVDAVEGQGTGGLLSDAVEARALASVYGEGRPADRPLPLGSVKSNLGHTQGASGVAGVIKMVQAMRHGVLPRTLHTEVPSPHISWEEGRIRLLTEATPWPATDRPRRAGVSAFGFGGTDAHVILEQAPHLDHPPPPPPLPEAGRGPAAAGVVLWPVSGCDPDALRGQATRLLAHLDRRPELRPADVGLSLATSRAALTHRGAVVGESRQELLDGLRALAGGRGSPRVVQGSAGRRHRLVVLLTGRALAPGTGKQLYDAFPAFADAFDAVCAELDAPVGSEARDAMLTGPAGDFAIQVALFRLVESWGVRPGVVRGHGVGGPAADHLGGRLTLPEACAALTGSPHPADTPRDFAATARTLAREGTVYLELGGHEVAELLDGEGLPAVAALRPGAGEVAAVAAALAHVHAHGTAVDWQAVFAGADARRVDLPTYAFRRARYWRAAFDLSRVNGAR